MKRMLLVELKNCLRRKEFMFVSLLVIITSITSFLAECYNFFGAELTNVRSAYDLGMVQGINSLLPALVLISPMLATILYSDSYYSDYKLGVYKNILSRTDVSLYLWSKAIVIFAITFLTFFIPMILNQALVLIAFPVEGYANHYSLPEYGFAMNYVPQAMFDLYRIQNPLLYNLLNVIIISLFSALFAVFSYTIYFYTKKGKFTVITGVFLGFIAVEIIMGALNLKQYAINTYMIPGNYGSFSIMLGWICILLSLCLIVIYITINKKELALGGE